MICPSCGKEIHEEDPAYCPHCGKPLKHQRTRTGFPIAAGVLTVIASCFTLIPGVLGTVAFIFTLPQYRYAVVPPGVLLLVMGILGFLAFALGLAGGILTLKRNHFWLSITGASIVLDSGVVALIVIGLQGVYSLSLALLVGLPVVILGILGVTFTAVSKKEFT